MSQYDGNSFVYIELSIQQGIVISDWNDYVEGIDDTPYLQCFTPFLSSGHTAVLEFLMSYKVGRPDRSIGDWHGDLEITDYTLKLCTNNPKAKSIFDAFPQYVSDISTKLLPAKSISEKLNAQIKSRELLNYFYANYSPIPLSNNILECVAAFEACSDTSSGPVLSGIANEYTKGGLKDPNAFKIDLNWRSNYTRLLYSIYEEVIQDVLEDQQGWHG